MKRLILFLSVVSLNVLAHQPFEFKSYKDNNGFLESGFLKKLADIFHPDVFFETGTYMGQTTEHAAPYFKEIHTVELHDGQFERARSKLARFRNIAVHHGKSQDLIAQVAPQLQGTILFWLDAHYSGEGTGKGSDDKDPNAFTAIREELQAIRELGIQDCIILIDDIRGFGTRINEQDYLGCWCYPTVQEVVRDLRAINSEFSFALVGDILFAYDARKYHPQFSPTVVACTQTRLYDGFNLSDVELLHYEKTIMDAPEHEKESMRKLCGMVMMYKDPFFWHDLVFGLVELGSGNYDLAKKAFTKIKSLKQNPPQSLSYNHWRIDKYLKECNPETFSKSGTVLNRYQRLLEQGTYDGQDWRSFAKMPKSRYDTFLMAFEHFEQHAGKVVVELGTTRSFVHGGLVGCNSDDTKYWTPGNPENWDWGAGCFTRMAAECLAHLNPTIHTIDLARSHIERCKIITADYKNILTYHVCSSLDFLKTCPFKIDLLYLDTGDMWPIEPTANLQLGEAQIIVERDLLAPNGIILIDDVRNQTPKKFGEKSDLGKSKYAIPYLLKHGYEIVADEYQVILKKKQ